jgi:hypothetical protein
MPSLHKPNTQTIIEKIKTEQGEITVNINMNITVDGSNISISTQTKEEDNQIENKKAVFVPEEMFGDLPTVNFGQKV